MKYKGLLLDIDNTLYDYNLAHDFAKDKVFKLCEKKFNISISEINLAYNKARYQVHIELVETAASHNRLLYFQKMLEILSINPLIYSIDIYNTYWNNFLDQMKPFDGVYQLLNIFKNKICLITDLTAHIQFRKISKLGLDKYCNNLVTSEEAGHEKPHPYIYMLSLQKLGLKHHEVCMIGDNFEKDIKGAENFGVQSIWLNKSNRKEQFNKKMITEVVNFKEILELI